ncbi:HD-GYP domain-containing protein [Desulfoluna spongiiphila]|uniref:HD-GYP domain-containing protein n=1 Tax=Desulfoluna spongiiphila TaxID=419481 RepID=UPI001259D828|nr:HD domain-containing phosphohydrolase [Desulfoluna spongiiphila]VVS93079.1 hd-gyp domain [Desulfoluna spongiiphila]
MRYRVVSEELEHDGRASIHFALLVCVMGVYGGQVCPVVESFPLWLWGLHLVVLLLVCRGLRMASSRWVFTRVGLQRQVGVQLVVDLCLFALAGYGIGVHNMVRYGADMESTLRLGTGFLIMGFFIGADLALTQDRLLALRRGGNPLAVAVPLLTVPQKFTLVTVISLFSVMVILYFVISFDLNWLMTVGIDNLAMARRAVLVEIGFIILILAAYTANLIVTYAKNLRLFVSEETRTLTDVAQGNLDTRVPVAFNDEFGIIAGYTNRMIEGLKEQNAAMELLRDVIINSMATLAETRDNETGAHLRRTQHYVRLLAEELAEPHGLDGPLIDLFYKTAPLHDIGKVGVPDAILLKPGPLTEAEFEIMKKHTTYGEEAIARAAEQMGEDAAFLIHAGEIASAHHEKWDGSGYPRGLAGTAIPLSARLMALADVYDALRSERVYKKAFSHEEAKMFLLDQGGSHFDPDVVAAFLRCEAAFIRVAERFRDEGDEALS